MQNTTTFNSQLSPLIGRIDEAISALEAQYNRAGDCNTRESSQPEDIREAPTSHSNSEQKAFAEYLIHGDVALQHKSYLLSKNIENGGYMVPNTIFERMDLVMQHLCPLRTLAKVDTVHGDHYELLLDKWAADAGWSQDRDLDEATTTDLTKLCIPTFQLYARPKANQKILEDAGSSIEEWIIDKVTQKMAALENAAFLSGDGVTQPKGIFAYPQKPLGQYEWGHLECVEQLSDKPEIQLESLLSVVTATPPQYLANASWLMSRSAWTALLHLTDQNGRILLQPAMGEKIPPILLGYPVFITDDMPQLSAKESTTPILFGDFRSGYQIVDSGNISILRDPYSAKPFIEFFTTKRVGGDVVDFQAIRGVHCVIAA